MTAVEILARAAAGHSITPDDAWTVIHEVNRLTALVEGRVYQPPDPACRRDEQLAIT